MDVLEAMRLRFVGSMSGCLIFSAVAMDFDTWLVCSSIAVSEELLVFLWLAQRVENCPERPAALSNGDGML